MSIIYSYPTTQPTLDDLLIGTDVGDDNVTKSFTVQSLVSLINAESGSGTLTGVTISTDAFLTAVGNPTGPAVAYTIGLAATGTPSSTTFLRGDNQWVIPTVSAGIGVYSSNVLVTNDLSSANFTGAGVVVSSDVDGNVLVNIAGAVNAVESINAGSGIGLNSTTGNVIVTNTGITGLVEGGGISITTNTAGQATLTVPPSAGGTVTSVAPSYGLSLYGTGTETVNPAIGLNYGTVFGNTNTTNYINTVDGYITDEDSLIPHYTQAAGSVYQTRLGDIPTSALTNVESSIADLSATSVKHDTDLLPSVNKVLNIITLTDAEYTAIGTGNYAAGTLYLTTATGQPQNTVNFTINTSAINATGSCGFTQSTTVNGSVVNPIAVTGSVGSQYTVATTITPTGSNCSISGGNATQTITGTIPATPTPAAVTQTLAARTISAPAAPGNVNDTLQINTNNITGTQFTTNAPRVVNGTQGGPFNTSDFNLTATANTGYEFSTGITALSIPANGTYNQSTSTYGSNSTIGTFNATTLSLKSYPVSYTVNPQITGGAYNLTITSTSNTFSGSATSGSSTAAFGTTVEVTATITPTGTDVLSPSPLTSSQSITIATSGNTIDLGTLTGSISASTSTMTLNPTTSFTPPNAWPSPPGQWGYSINGGNRVVGLTASGQTGLEVVWTFSPNPPTPVTGYTSTGTTIGSVIGELGANTTVSASATGTAAIARSSVGIAGQGGSPGTGPDPNPSCSYSVTSTAYTDSDISNGVAAGMYLYDANTGTNPYGGSSQSYRCNSVNIGGTASVGYVTFGAGGYIQSVGSC
jgi:hypothetical protein